MVKCAKGNAGVKPGVFKDFKYARRRVLKSEAEAGRSVSMGDSVLIELYKILDELKLGDDRRRSMQGDLRFALK